MFGQCMMVGEQTSAELEKWKLRFEVSGDSKAIYVPLWTGNYLAADKMIVDWGDGNTTTVTGPYVQNDYNDNINPKFSHTYNSVGEYDVTMSASSDTWSRTQIGPSGQDSSSASSDTFTGYKEYLEAVLNAMPSVMGANKHFLSDTSGKHMDYTFFGCKRLDYISDDIFSKNTDSISFNYTFCGCSNFSLYNEARALTFSPFAGCSDVVEFNYTFSGIQDTEGVSSSLFEDCVKAEYFNGTFSDITPTGSSWNVVIWPPQYEGLFEHTSAKELVDTFAGSKIHDISRMFVGCNKLESLVGCFQGATIGSFYTPYQKIYDGQPTAYNWYDLFDDCVNLKDITKLFYYASIPTGRFAEPPIVTPDPFNPDSTTDVSSTWEYKSQAYPVARFANSPNLAGVDYAFSFYKANDDTKTGYTFDVVWFNSEVSAFPDQNYKGDFQTACGAFASQNTASKAIGLMTKEATELIVKANSAMNTFYSGSGSDKMMYGMLKAQNADYTLHAV